MEKLIGPGIWINKKHNTFYRVWGIVSNYQFKGDKYVLYARSDRAIEEMSKPLIVIHTEDPLTGLVVDERVLWFSNEQAMEVLRISSREDIDIFCRPVDQWLDRFKLSLIEG